MDLLAAGHGDNAAITQVLDAAADAADVLAGNDTDARWRMLEALLERVDIRESGIVIHIRPSAIDSQYGGDGSSMQPSADEDGNATLAVELPAQLSRRGTGSRIVLATGEQGSAEPDGKLVRLLADAHRWNRTLAEGEVASLRELAQQEQVDRSDIGRALNLAYLAPDIVAAILDGRQPVGLTAKRLKRMSELPLDWTAQRRALGIES